jgi:AcrR family transcriptional regulator
MAHIDNSRSRACSKAQKRGRTARSRSNKPESAQVLPSPRRTPRQSRAHETVEAVVEAAARLLVESGYDRTSTNAIARRAGVSVGSLYQYFSSKEEVYRAVVKRHREEVLPVIAEALDRMEDPQCDIVELSLRLMRDMAKVNARNPQLMAAIDGELGWLEREGDSLEGIPRRVEGILRHRVGWPPRRIPVTAALLVMTLAPLSRWLVHRSPGALDTELFMQGVGRMLRGLLAEG